MATTVGYRLRHKPTNHLLAQPYLSATEANLDARRVFPSIADHLTPEPVTLPCDCAMLFVRNARGVIVCAKCGVEAEGDPEVSNAL